jgi:hypothetical protein
LGIGYRHKEEYELNLIEDYRCDTTIGYGFPFLDEQRSWDEEVGRRKG